MYSQQTSEENFNTTHAKLQQSLIKVKKHFKTKLEADEYSWKLFSQSNFAKVLFKVKNGDPAGKDMQMQRALKRWTEII